MSLASKLLPRLEKIRGIGGKLGLRPFRVTVRQNVWVGGIPGRGTKTTTDTVLLVNGQNPGVHQLSNADAMLSGGIYSNQDIRIGPLTPPFVGGGVQYGTLDPAEVTGTEIFFHVVGPGIPPVEGVWCKRIRDEADSSLHVYLIVRATGIRNP